MRSYLLGTRTWVPGLDCWMTLSSAARAAHAKLVSRDRSFQRATLFIRLGLVLDPAAPFHSPQQFNQE
jgi:hypothetical protein